MTFLSHTGEFHQPVNSDESRGAPSESEIALICAHITNGRARILDCGCGEGSTVLDLSGRGFRHVVGIDVSVPWLDNARYAARQRKLDVSFVQADPCHTPFRDKCFDVVLALGGVFGRFSKSESDAGLLEEAHRLLTPGGLLCISFADGDWFKTHSEPYSVYPTPGGLVHRHCQLSAGGNCLMTRTMITDEKNDIVTDRTSLEWLHGEMEMADLLHSAGFDVPQLETGAASHAHGPNAPRPLVIAYAH